MQPTEPTMNSRLFFLIWTPLALVCLAYSYLGSPAICLNLGSVSKIDIHQDGEDLGTIPSCDSGLGGVYRPQLIEHIHSLESAHRDFKQVGLFSDQKYSSGRLELHLQYTNKPGQLMWVHTSSNRWLISGEPKLVKSELMELLVLHSWKIPVLRSSSLGPASEREQTARSLIRLATTYLKSRRGHLCSDCGLGDWISTGRVGLDKMVDLGSDVRVEEWRRRASTKLNLAEIYQLRKKVPMALAELAERGRLNSVVENEQPFTALHTLTMKSSTIPSANSQSLAFSSLLWVDESVADLAQKLSMNELLMASRATYDSKGFNVLTASFLHTSRGSRLVEVATKPIHLDFAARELMVLHCGLPSLELLRKATKVAERFLLVDACAPANKDLKAVRWNLYFDQGIEVFAELHPKLVFSQLHSESVKWVWGKTSPEFQPTRDLLSKSTNSRLLASLGWESPQLTSIPELYETRGWVQPIRYFRR